MKVRVLQLLPGTIGGLPAGENFEAGRDYEVEDGIAETMKRNGWAVDAAPPVPAAFGHRGDPDA